MLVRYLTRDEIEALNRYLAIRHGFKHDVFQDGNLALCVESPQRTLFGTELYAGKLEKAAALMKEISKLHPFAAGNKRTAFLATTVFLEINGYALSCDTQEAIDISLRTAQCVSDIQEITQWLEKHTRRSQWQSTE
nr:type II toxin-antitoxin system death-on-curing family toxin [Candidatus Njordarchaeum guaymaensis]